MNREIYINKNVPVAPIQWVYGTDIIQIDFEIIDFDISKVTSVNFYSLTNSDVRYTAVGSRNGQIVSFTPIAGFFAVGSNSLQCELHTNAGNVYTFAVAVWCERNNKLEGAEQSPEKLASYIEQINENTANIEKMKLPKLTDHIQYRDVAVDDYVEISVLVNGAVSYRWQYSDNLTSWFNSTATGADTDTLSVKGNLRYNGRYYRCIVTTADGQVITGLAKINVHEKEDLSQGGGVTKEELSDLVNQYFEENPVSGVNADGVRYIVDSEYIETIDITTGIPVEPTEPDTPDEPTPDEPDEPALINLFDADAVTRGYTLSKTTGAESKSDTYYASDFVPVEAGKDYTMFSALNSNGVVFRQGVNRINGYKADKTFHSNLTSWGDASDHSKVVGITIPDGVYYVRWANLLTHLSDRESCFCEAPDDFPESIPAYGESARMASPMLLPDDEPMLLSAGTTQTVKRLKGSDYVPESDIYAGKLKKIGIKGGRRKATYGANMIPNLSEMTAGAGCAWVTDHWEVQPNGELYADLSVTQGVTYRVTIDMSVLNTSALKGELSRHFNISLGDAVVTSYCAGDYLPDSAFMASETGTQRLSIIPDENVSIKVKGIRVVPVTNLAELLAMFGENPVYGYGQSYGFGGQSAILYKKVDANMDAIDDTSGVKNTAFGSGSQNAMDTGCWNTAFGYNTQNKATHAKGNTAVGAWAQTGLTFGYYNNAFGESCQGGLTTGNWNDAHGIEAQCQLKTGDNNVAMGRRSQARLVDGCRNVAIGAWSAFMASDMPKEGAWATKSANNQTLVGASSTQCSDVQADNLTCVGYRSRGTTDATAIGMEASAKGVGSIAIGKGAIATNDNEMVLGSASIQDVKIAGKTIHFNADGTVTWS